MEILYIDVCVLNDASDMLHSGYVIYTIVPAQVDGGAAQKEYRAVIEMT